MNWPDAQHARWHAQPDDTIGGWCVTTTEDPPSAGLPNMVAGFVHEEAARHIVELHNAWLVTEPVAT
jgi:hypothetical protein